MKLKFASALIFIICSAFAGCVAGEVVYEEPPPPQVEVWGTPPGPNYVWIEGYWVWHSRWLWVPGRWEARPYPRATWVPHYWVRRSAGWHRVEGHWK